MVIEEADNTDKEVENCYICGWPSPVTDMFARAGVHICPACDHEFDQILLEDI